MEILSLISVVWDIFTRLYKRYKPKDPQEILRHRLYLKNKFDAYVFKFKRNRENGGDDYSETIIRDIKNIDSYPNITKNKKGISPWFKVAIVGFYPRGVQLLLRWTYIKILNNDGWVFANNEDENSMIVGLLGNVPYELIIDVDWNGDDYYQIPHIYCKFSRKGQPYEELIFCEEHKGLNGKYFIEIIDYDSVKKLSSHLGFEETY